MTGLILKYYINQDLKTYRISNPICFFLWYNIGKERGGKMKEMVLSEMTTRDKAYKIGGFLLGGFLIYSFTTDMNWG